MSPQSYTGGPIENNPQIYRTSVHFRTRYIRTGIIILIIATVSGKMPPPWLKQKRKPDLRSRVKEQGLCGINFKVLRAAYGEAAFRRIETSSSCYRIKEYWRNGKEVAAIRTYVLHWVDGKTTKVSVDRLQPRKLASREGDDIWDAQCRPGLRGVEMTMLWHHST